MIARHTPYYRSGRNCLTVCLEVSWSGSYAWDLNCCPVSPWLSTPTELAICTATFNLQRISYHATIFNNANITHPSPFTERLIAVSNVYKNFTTVSVPPGWFSRIGPRLVVAHPLNSTMAVGLHPRFGPSAVYWNAVVHPNFGLFFSFPIGWPKLHAACRFCIWSVFFFLRHL